MENLKRRGLSLLLALVMIVSLFAGIQLPQASAATVDYVYSGDYVYNWGTRGTTATFLSPMAEDWWSSQPAYSTLAAMDGSNDLDAVSNSALYEALASIMAGTHNKMTNYDATRTLFQYTDCQNSAKTTTKISSFYSGTGIGPSWDSGATWNREHVWPNSKSTSGSDSNTTREQDIMMLRPTAKDENGGRGNTAYGESSGYYHPNSESDGAYDLRGDVSRIVLYVYVRYGTDSTYADGALDYMWGTSGVMESVDVLLNWMEEDPVDTWELGRNDAVESITGTRNVFVDYPELAFLLFNEEVPANYTSPSGSAAFSEYNITATSNNDSYGTVSTNGTHINASPSEGYYAAGYTVISGTASVTQNGNVFTVDASTDCTVQINFAAREQATVTFMENGVQRNTATAYLEDSIILPAHTSTILDGYEFVGWVESPVSEDTDAKPDTIYTEGSSYTVNSDTILYALYSHTTESGGATSGDYVKVTSDLGNWAGEYLIVYETNSVILNGSLSPLDAPSNYVEVTISNDTITAEQGDNYKFTISAVDDSYTIKSASGYYIGKDSTKNGLDSNTSKALLNTISWSNGSVAIAGSAGNKLQFNKASDQLRFRYFSSTQQPICLYVKEGTAGTTYYTTSTCDHTNTTTTTVDATCTADGSTTVTCDDCSTVISETTIPATGHNYVDGTCTVCGNSEPAESVQVVIYAPGYMMALSSTYPDGSHYNSGVAVTLDGTTLSGYSAQTDVWTIVDNADGTYSIMLNDQYLGINTGYNSMALFTAEDAVNHKWEIIPVGENLYNIRNTTKANDNDKTGYCIEWNSDSYTTYNPNTPYSEKPYQLSFYVVSGTLPTFTCEHDDTTTNHKDNNCGVDGYTTVTCNKCGQQVSHVDLPATGEHNWVAGTVTPPTTVEQGYTTYYCNVCGNTEKRDFTDPVEGTEGITVTFVVPAGVAPIKSQTTDSTGIELPTPGIPSADYEYSFVGWTTSIVDNSTTAPTLYIGNYAPTQNVTLYAVYTYAPADNVFTRVDSTADLVIGNEIVIVAANTAVAMSTTQNSNNRGQIAITKDTENNKVTINDTVQVLVLEEGTVSDTYAFNTGSGYLYAASSSKNYLRTQESIDGNASWEITITDGIATVKAKGTNTRNWMRHNNSDSIFSAYASGQADISLYTKGATQLTYTTEITRTEAYTVTFSTPSGVTAIPSTICGKTGITLPTAGVPANNHGYVFKGWATAAYDNVTSKPTMYNPGEEFHATQDTTFYAVYEYTVADGTNTEYVKKNIADINAADSVVITMTHNGTIYALSSANGTSAAPSKEYTVTVSNDGSKEILTAEPYDHLKWNIVSTDGGFIIYVENNHSKWLYCNNTNNGVRVGTEATKVFVVDEATGYLKNTKTSDARYVGVYVDGSDWRCYNNTTGNTKNQTLGFYVKSTGTTYWTTEVEVIELKFYGASLEVGEGISINYKVAASLFAENLYDLDSACATFVFNKESEDKRTFTVSDPVLSGDYYVFQLKNIRPDWMGDVVTATLTATDANGESITSKAIEYSVKDYCYNKLENETAETSFSTLLVDMLNYGAATQLHTGYKTDALVNADLTDTQKGWGSDTTKTLTNVQSLSGEAGSVSWKGAALFLRETTRIRLRFAAEDVTGLTVVATVGGNSYELTNFISAGNGQYYVFFDNLLATQMRDNVEFTVMDGDAAVSKTLTYSVASYAAAVSESNTTLYNMIHAMMRYGDSVDVYAG